MSDRTLTLLLATGATFACASLVARVRSRAARRLTMSGAAEPAVRWALDDDARTAASADQAHILAQAWGSDPEIGVFGGTLCAVPFVRTTTDGLVMHGSLAYCNGGGLREGSPRPGVCLVHTAVGPQEARSFVNSFVHYYYVHESDSCTQDLYLRWRAHALATRGYVVLIADLLGDPHGDGWEPAWCGPRREVYTGEGRPLLQRRTRERCRSWLEMARRLPRDHRRLPRDHPEIRRTREALQQLAESPLVDASTRRAARAV